jgi:hypothetical protein
VGAFSTFEDEPAEHRRDVRRFPVPVEIRLREANVARPEALFEKRLTTDAEVSDSGDLVRQRLGVRAFRNTQRQNLTFGQLEAQATAAHGGERREDEAAKEGGRGGVGQRGFRATKWRGLTHAESEGWSEWWGR